MKSNRFDCNWTSETPVLSSSDIFIHLNRHVISSPINENVAVLRALPDRTTPTVIDSKSEVIVSA